MDNETTRKRLDNIYGLHGAVKSYVDLHMRGRVTSTMAPIEIQLMGQLAEIELLMCIYEELRRR
jgi:hypothetical protein